ncbi:hypothetical protein COY93_04155 [Candidatus Uhrbacteria bacterium CG_4_10_14_0_8_um_filter_58_22]|uniref:Prepilin-type N-terminal cleavage/methylation domain-containing protein n=1 Tax=Candidatus Uhrbacteria bacterium CG_4_10_14_0_8_um_filter_58_22 TaxID=1975029 RepID=A0A2M7Q964_9BACT|nr:MAG: hypothetical protein AUJ19_04805 [Parcubacteria group bacterium CG1_02_58_44]PIY62032.1 MAG: hypothetical protein COY93_04155 [Candidatus Uhrbacteria bacterium CG_4_10_14_0_8_um_filter_58_22]
MKALHRQSKTAESWSGFSLVEVIVVLGVMTLILVMVVQIFMVSYDTYAKQSARANNDSGIMLATRTISETARGTLSVLTNKTVNGTNYASSSNELVLALAAIDENGNIIEDETDYVAYYRDGLNPNAIFSDVEAAPGSYRTTGKKLVTNNNVTLTFRYDSQDLGQVRRISIYLRNEQTVRTTTVKTEAWSSIFLHNR